MTRIVAVAVRLDNGTQISMPPPNRHHNCLHALSKAGLLDGPDGRRIQSNFERQGLVTDTGRYVTREEAWQIAEAAGQLLECAPTDHIGGRLYSEDVW